MAKPWYRWPTIHPPSHPDGIKLNKWILWRDGYTCQVRLPPCTSTATVADHIVPTSRGGAWFDPNNLRGACQDCNYARRTPTSPPNLQTNPRTVTQPERW